MFMIVRDPLVLTQYCTCPSGADCNVPSCGQGGDNPSGEIQHRSTECRPLCVEGKTLLQTGTYSCQNGLLQTENNQNEHLCMKDCNCPANADCGHCNVNPDQKDVMNHDFHEKGCIPKCQEGYYVVMKPGFNKSKGLVCLDGDVKDDDLFSCEKMQCSCPDGEPQDASECNDFDQMINCKECTTKNYSLKLDPRHANLLKDEQKYVRPIDPRDIHLPELQRRTQKHGRACSRSKWDHISSFDKLFGTCVGVGIPLLLLITIIGFNAYQLPQNTVDEERERRDMFMMEEKNVFCGLAATKTQCESLRKVDEQWWRNPYTDFSTSPPSAKDGEWFDVSTYLK